MFLSSVQYAQCIKGKLKDHGYDDVELRFDIWRSMNGRFNQRQIDPRIDLLSPDTKWSVFEETTWLLPLLTNLSDWRTRMMQIENDLASKDQNVLITFVADFPGKIPLSSPSFSRSSFQDFIWKITFHRI